MQKEKREIVITLEGGIIQDISGIPDDVRIKVMDFDIGDTDLGELKENKDGDQYIESIYEKAPGFNVTLGVTK